MGGSAAVVPLPADWMAARAPRLEAEDALALRIFRAKIIYCVDLTPSNALI